MAINMIVAAMFVLLCVLVPDAFAETTPAPAPKAVLPERTYEFEPVVEGTLALLLLIVEK